MGKTKFAKCVDSSLRIHGYLDMDCFECQVRQLQYPGLVGLPCAVVNKCDRVISVNYEARKFNVKRFQSREEALSLCPDLHCLKAPVLSCGKSDHSDLYTASYQVFDIVKEYWNTRFEANNNSLRHYPSDEIHFELTSPVLREWNLVPFYLKMLHFVKFCSKNADLSSKLVLLAGTLAPILLGKFVSCQIAINFFLAAILIFYFQFRSDIDRLLDRFRTHSLLKIGEDLMRKIGVYTKTKMTSSTGVSTTKIRAKLASSVIKPQGSFILHPEDYAGFISTKRFNSLPGLQKKLGERIKLHYKIETVQELSEIDLNAMIKDKICTPKEALIIRKLLDGED